ncbi:hypothetical protein ANN_04322 [Periplaneta americana]|uniref:Mutator-like transposase domain-containing protein n=1 Tax=Periplaneta americana TaxID=6978 RepID=A0ABQ8T9F4_PERAM|nr:hypothetical protein ANN_04322 [Periplaneta americana]
MARRKSISNRNKAKALKRWTNKNEPVVQCSDSTTVDNSECIVACDASQSTETKPNLRQQKLEASNSADQFESTSSECKYIVVDCTVLSDLVQDLKCNDCHNKTLKIDIGKEQNGFAHDIQLKCIQCEDIKKSIYTSKRLENKTKRPAFDVNQRMTQAFIRLGKGHAGLQHFSMIMNMYCMSKYSFNEHSKLLLGATTDVVANILTDIRSEVRGAYADLIVDGEIPPILDIGVSYDGTWLTRGHSSMYGVGCVIDILTGYVIDYQVMSKSCRKCVHARQRYKNPQDFKIWYDIHKQECDINHTGSSGAMEMEAAIKMWNRSQDFGLRYTSLLSDGDAKTFNKLCALKPYGPEHKIEKQECVNHVGKRLGTALRTVVLDSGKQGQQLGGRAHGSLKSVTINKLQKYYTKAIYRNKGDTEATKTAIYATLLHSISTDKNPSIRNVHLAKTLERCLAKILPVYQKLASDSLLKRCTECRTQNANESLHGMIWRNFPKEMFASKRRIDIAVGQAICDFNVGTTETVIKTQKQAGLSPGRTTVKLGVKRDSNRVMKAKSRSNKAYQRYRRSVKLARLRSMEAAKVREGPTYEAGLF